MQYFENLKISAQNILNVSAKFTGPLVAGSFVFNNIQTNLFVPKIGSLYIVENVSFSADINQLIFSDAIDQAVNNGFFILSIRRASDNSGIERLPVQFASYKENRPMALHWVNNRQNDTIYCNLNGALIQTPDLIAMGRANVTITTDFVIREIDNRDFIAKHY